MDSRALSGEAVFEEDMSDRPLPQERINSCVAGYGFVSQ